MKKLLFILPFFFALTSSADEKSNIKIAVGTFPESVQYKIAEKFKKYVETSSKLTVELFYGQYFGNETSALMEVQKNSVQIAVISSGPCDNFDPDVIILDYPFLFDKYEDVDAKLYGPLGDIILKSLEKANLKGLAISEEGFRNLTNDIRPIHSVKDIDGLKIRVMESAFHKEILQCFNAEAIPLGWPIYKQLANHVVDGEDNPLPVIYNSRLYEVQKYLTLTHHMFSAILCIANLNWFNTLNATDQLIILSSMKKAADWGKTYNREMEKTMLKKLKKTDIIIDENPDIESFKEQVQNLKDSIFFSDPNLKKLLEDFFKKQ